LLLFALLYFKLGLLGLGAESPTFASREIDMAVFTAIIVDQHQMKA
jgi:hypothetical protein